MTLSVMDAETVDGVHKITVPGFGVSNTYIYIVLHYVNNCRNFGVRILKKKRLKRIKKTLRRQSVCKIAQL